MILPLWAPTWLFRLCHYVTEAKWEIYRFFRPLHPRAHKAFPRHKYLDVDTVIENVGFALILDFWYEQVVDGIVSWDTSVGHKECYNWMEDAVKYIQIDRPELKRQLDNAITEAVKDFSLTAPIKKNTKAEKAMKLSHKLETKINKFDTHHLYNLVKYRGYLWT
jgi:hypothetical protein